MEVNDVETRTPTLGELARALEHCDAGRAVVLGATIAIGSCTFAACADPPVGPKIEPIVSTQAEPELEIEPEAVQLDADEGRLGAFDVAPGFTPDPMIHRGSLAGGPFDAHEIDDRCEGWIAAEPDFVFEAERPFAELAIMAVSDEDVALFVVGPDGEARCAADTDGTHPLVRSEHDAGLYRVWVAAERRGREAAYLLALSELDDAAPAGLQSTLAR